MSNNPAPIRTRRAQRFLEWYERVTARVAAEKAAAEKTAKETSKQAS